MNYIKVDGQMDHHIWFWNNSKGILATRESKTAVCLKFEKCLGPL